MSQKLYISWAMFEDDIMDLTRQIEQSPHDFKRLLLVSRGGLTVGAALANTLTIKDVQSIAVESYSGEQQGQLRIINEFAFVDGEDLLIIDDLSDSGETLKFLKAKFPLAKTACLYTKPKGHDRADFSVRQYEHSQWLVFPWEIIGQKPQIQPKLG